MCVLIESITQIYGNGNAPKVFVLGDAGADIRFLQKTPENFHSTSKYGWKLMSLDQSFRLSLPEANFVNSIFLKGQEYIDGTGEGVKPSYILAKKGEKHTWSPCTGRQAP